MRTRRTAFRCARTGLAAALVSLALPLSATAQDPLSAIDWLALPPPLDPALSAALPLPLDEPPAAGDARVPPVDVQPLEAASAAGVGLLPSRVSGLPVSLWRDTPADQLARAIDGLPSQSLLPASQSLSTTLLLAEAQPPRGRTDLFLTARLDALIRRGAIAPARELVALLPPGQPVEIVTRQADIALLDGDTGPVCADILARSSLPVPTALRVFCLARSGAWDQAATLMEAARALGDLSDGTYFRLLRFLDPDLAETLPDLPPPSAARLTPLEYRLLVAAGAPLPTATLPLPFAVAEVSGDAGWKPRIEAAERLVRAGALAEPQLFAAYSHRAPAASGGVWDRVAAYQALEAALEAADPAAIGPALEAAWPLFQDHNLAVPLARHIAPELADHVLTGAAAEMAQAAMLLSRDYERLARGITTEDPALRFAAGLAIGVPAAPPDIQAEAIAEAWDDGIARPPVPEPGMLGATLLDTLAALEAGADGNLRALTEALRQLRALGLEDTARRAALQLRLAAPPA